MHIEVRAATCVGWLYKRWKRYAIAPAFQDIASLLEFCSEEFSAGSWGVRS